MQRRRAIERCGTWARRAIALLLSLSAMACRDTEEPGSASRLASFTLLPGDRFVYDVWATNARGAALDTSLTRTVWEVLNSDPGGSGIATIVRTRTPLPPRPVVIDTFALRSAADGRIQRQGFLAELIARREQRQIPIRWDTLADLQGSSWMVGPLDSGGTERVAGFYSSGPSYVDVTIDGEPMILPAHEIEMTASSLEVHLWVSCSPPCFPLWEEYADSYSGIRYGSRAILREAFLAPGPRD